MLKTIRRIISMLVLGFIAVMLWRIVEQNNAHLTVDESAPLIVEQLRAVQRIETTEMNIIKILKGEQELADRLPWFDRDNMVSDFLFGESISMEIYGTVTAGFDLSQLTTGAISSIHTGSVSITLPTPQILHTSLDPETQVFDRDLWLLNKWDPTTETKLRNQALAIIRTTALEQWILDEAIENAQETLQSLVGSRITIDNIIIIWPNGDSLLSQ